MAEVQIIKPSIDAKHIENITKRTKKKKVCAYCRVSTDMLRNQGFAGILKNGANFRYVMRTSEKMTLNRDYCCFQKSRAIFMT